MVRLHLKEDDKNYYECNIPHNCNVKSITKTSKVAQEDPNIFLYWDTPTNCIIAAPCETTKMINSPETIMNMIRIKVIIRD